MELAGARHASYGQAHFAPVDHAACRLRLRPVLTIMHFAFCTVEALVIPCLTMLCIVHPAAVHLAAT